MLSENLNHYEWSASLAYHYTTGNTHFIVVTAYLLAREYMNACIFKKKSKEKKTYSRCIIKCYPSTYALFQNILYRVGK